MEMRQLFGSLAKGPVVSFNDFVIQMHDVRENVSQYEMRRIGFDIMDRGQPQNGDGGDKYISAEELSELVEYSSA